MITGGAGFIGSNLIKLLLKVDVDCEVVNFDALTYAGNLESLRELEFHPRYTFVKGDVTDKKAVLKAMEGCSGVFHLAAESHVDRSILDPGPFLSTNVIGTQMMLDAAREHKVERFIQVSTDEVYGSILPDDPPFTETNRLKPNSPYSASKASGDLLVRSYVKTYGFPGVITRCSNNFGPYQFPEKILPLFLRNLQWDEPVPVYGDGQQIRDWIYVDDHCRALIRVMERGRVGEIYNIGGRCELKNLDMVKMLLKALDKPESLIKFVTDRPGHDRRYAIDNSKIEAELGWKPKHSFSDALPKTIKWYCDNEEWVNSIISGDYLEYYERQYGSR